MHCPKLDELSSPPQGKVGWPWTEESLQSQERMSCGRPWPKISIVTPNHNYGRFIEKTIRSVLLQGYPNLEYIVIDDGSTDDSVDIIRKYEKWITYWTSGAKKGQVRVINRGFRHATGDILGWLNSDDIFEPDSLKTVAEKLVNGIEWIMGASVHYYTEEEETKLLIPDNDITPARWIERFLKGATFIVPQASVFWKKNVWDTCGPLKEHLEYAFDHELFLRIFHKIGKPAVVDQVFSYCLLHKDCKSCSKGLNFVLDNVQSGVENVRFLSQTQRWKAPFIAAHTRSRVALYHIINQADQGKLPHPFFSAISALRHHPVLIFDRMFWGFLKRKLLKNG